MMESSGLFERLEQGKPWDSADELLKDLAPFLEAWNTNFYVWRMLELWGEEKFRERMRCLELDCVRLLGDVPVGLERIMNWLSWANDDDLRGFVENMRREHGSPWEEDFPFPEYLEEANHEGD